MRILRSLNRRISWLMAEKSFRRPFVGSMATIMGAVPISRAMDIAKSGEGTIYLPDPVTNPLVLKGVGTDFTGPDFKPGYSIYLPNINGESHKLDIAHVHGPTMISLKTAPAHKDAIFQLTGSQDLTGRSVSGFQGSKYKIAPHVDQTDVYNAVFQNLEADSCIGIFPEGGSHDRTSLLPLKGTSPPSYSCYSVNQAQPYNPYPAAGIAIMALGSLARGPTVTIVPVGMNYFSAHKFRSRAVIEFGDAVSILSSLVQDFQTGKRRDAVGSMMSQISQALASVTVSAPDYDTLMVCCTEYLSFSSIFSSPSRQI
jgi:glycerol-3-phosphate O-acyltransferase / dihydroxyacetone phosphate acyltransferase